MVPGTRWQCMKHSSFAAFALLLLVVAVVVAAITGTSGWRATDVQVHKQTDSKERP